MRSSMSEKVNLENVESRFSFLLVDQIPQSLMIRRIIVMHIDWELRYVDFLCPFQSRRSLHLAKPEPNASLEVPILSKTMPSHVTNLMF